MSRLRLGLEIDGATRGRQVRDIVQGLARLHGVNGALIVAPDGLVITSEVAQDVTVDSLAALAATPTAKAEGRLAAACSTAGEIEQPDRAKERYPGWSTCQAACSITGASM